jgi:hypothetical protein
MKVGLMKKKYLLSIAAGLLLLTSCGPSLHRYNCGSKRRCISHTETAKSAGTILQKARIKEA